MKITASNSVVLDDDSDMEWLSDSDEVEGEFDRDLEIKTSAVSIGECNGCHQLVNTDDFGRKHFLCEEEYGECDECFGDDYPAYRNHVWEEHGKNSYLTSRCGICGVKDLTNFSLFRDHYQQEHEITVYYCLQCPSLTFYDFDSVFNHHYTHAGDNSFLPEDLHERRETRINSLQEQKEHFELLDDDLWDEEEMSSDGEDAAHNAEIINEYSDTVYNCRLCSESNIIGCQLYKAHLAQHSNENGKEYYFCPLCPDLILDSNMAAYKHTNTHRNESDNNKGYDEELLYLDFLQWQLE